MATEHPLARFAKAYAAGENPPFDLIIELSDGGPGDIVTRAWRGTDDPVALAEFAYVINRRALAVAFVRMLRRAAPRLTLRRLLAELREAFANDAGKAVTEALSDDLGDVYTSIFNQLRHGDESRPLAYSALAHATSHLADVAYPPPGDPRFYRPAKIVVNHLVSAVAKYHHWPVTEPAAARHVAVGIRRYFPAPALATLVRRANPHVSGAGASGAGSGQDRRSGCRGRRNGSSRR